jgi:polyribonucleotide nucleotidyltransferase
MEIIQGICAVPEVGQVYNGKVVSIVAFGAFVEILPGKEGLLHISEISFKRLETVEEELKVGQMIEVKLIEIDEKTGKYRLSRKVLLEKPEGYVEPPQQDRGPRGPRDDRGGRDNRGGGYGDRGGSRGGDRGGDRGDRPPRRDFDRR